MPYELIDEFKKLPDDIKLHAETPKPVYTWFQNWTVHIRDMAIIIDPDLTDREKIEFTFYSTTLDSAVTRLLDAYKALPIHNAAGTPFSPLSDCPASNCNLAPLLRKMHLVFVYYRRPSMWVLNKEQKVIQKRSQLPTMLEIHRQRAHPDGDYSKCAICGGV